MDLFERNRAFLRNLYLGPFERHGIVFEAPWPAFEQPEPGLVASSKGPLGPWLDWGEEHYRLAYEHHAKGLDDNVPSGFVHTGTELFAAAFGCPVEQPSGSLPFALPCVETSRDADRVRVPELDAPPLDRVWAYAEGLRARLGPDAPIRVPDMQSPFDIAALIWRKEEMFYAMHDEPESVLRLVDLCCDFLIAFLAEYERRLGPVNLMHFPFIFAPREIGAWVSEDEAGALSPEAFERFCLPSLIRLSQAMGGFNFHCCADADHQWPHFLKVPELHGVNRVFTHSPTEPSIAAFSGGQVLVQLADEAEIDRLLALAAPTTRFLFVTWCGDEGVMDRIRGKLG